MLLVIDVGNTNTVLGLYDAERLVHDFRIETSRDGVTFTPVAEGAFDDPDRSRLNAVTPDVSPVPGVRFVRLWALSSQVPGGYASCPGAFGGCSYISVSELEVYGRAAR